MRRLGWLILMIVLISCGSTTPTPVGQPLAAAEPPAALGQRLRGPGLALTVHDMQRPAVLEGLSATPCSVFVLVNLTLENTTLQELSYSAGDFKLVDDAGAEYGNVPYGVPARLESGHLRRGQRVQGLALFEVRAQAQGVLLRYQPELGGASALLVGLE